MILSEFENRLKAGLV